MSNTTNDTVKWTEIIMSGKTWTVSKDCNRALVIVEENMGTQLEFLLTKKMVVRRPLITVQ